MGFASGTFLRFCSALSWVYGDCTNTPKDCGSDCHHPDLSFRFGNEHGLWAFGSLNLHDANCYSVVTLAWCLLVTLSILSNSTWPSAIQWVPSETYSLCRDLSPFSYHWLPATGIATGQHLLVSPFDTLCPWPRPCDEYSHLIAIQAVVFIGRRE